MLKVTKTPLEIAQEKWAAYDAGVAVKIAKDNEAALLREESRKAEAARNQAIREQSIREMELRDKAIRAEQDKARAAYEAAKLAELKATESKPDEMGFFKNIFNSMEKKVVSNTAKKAGVDAAVLQANLNKAKAIENSAGKSFNHVMDRADKGATALAIAAAAATGGALLAPLAGTVTLAGVGKAVTLGAGLVKGASGALAKAKPNTTGVAGPLQYAANAEAEKEFLPSTVWVLPVLIVGGVLLFGKQLKRLFR